MLQVGADSPANGGSGKTVSVLFDSGATGVWLNWVGCTDPECGVSSFVASAVGNFG